MDATSGTQVRHGSKFALVSLPKCKLVVVKGATRGEQFVIESDGIRVGKAPDNDFVVSDEAVSRVHFEIVRDAKGYLVRDLRSTNGTFLDGAEIKEAYLRPGSIVSLGSVELKFTPFEERIEIVPSTSERLGALIGGSLVMREIYGLIERLAATEATVLIGGETGTGKDLIAKTLHQLSKRATGPFVVMGCGAVTASLIESELFGHEKGAFTGAVTSRPGAFEIAAGGTIFLDEIGELSLDLQPKLLRVLEQREIRRVGGTKTCKVDLRVIAASRKDLRSEVEKGKFREDLYFRLNVVPIVAPPLRDRREDIPMLIDGFVASLGGDGAHTLSDATKAAMYAHDWPGNVRELRNVIERTLAVGSGSQSLFPESHDSANSGKSSRDEPFAAGVSFREAKEQWTEQFERRYLTWLLRRADGNISRAARSAHMDRKYLHKLLRKYEIDDRQDDDDAVV